MREKNSLHKFHIDLLLHRTPFVPNILLKPKILNSQSFKSGQNTACLVEKYLKNRSSFQSNEKHSFPPHGMAERSNSFVTFEQFLELT